MRGQIRKLGVAVAAFAAFAAGGAVYAVAGHQAPVSQFTGCLAVSSGKLSSFAQGAAPMDPCKAGEVAVHLSGGDITDVQTPVAGGLQGGTANGAASIALRPSFRLPQGCDDGQVAKAAAGTWSCGADVDTDTNTAYTAGFGLALTGTQFALDPQFALPQSCAAGGVAKRLNGAWACGVDADSGGDVTGVTASTGLAGGGAVGEVALSLADPYRLPQSCSTGQAVKKAASGWACDTDLTGASASLIVFERAGEEITLCGRLDVTCSSSGQAYARCPDDAFATGGGFYVRDGEIDIVESGAATLPPRSWRVSAQNRGVATAARYRAYVMCARMS